MAPCMHHMYSYIGSSLPGYSHVLYHSIIIIHVMFKQYDFLVHTHAGREHCENDFHHVIASVQFNNNT